MTRTAVLAAGLMSGTSLDGVTAALVRITEPAENDFGVELLGHRTAPYGAEREDRIRAAISRGSARDLALLHTDLGEWFAECLAVLLQDTGVKAADLTFVGSHGQTIWHESRRSSFQLCNPAVIAERLGVTVISDFRSRDVAAGGEGAPLVPRADRLLFSRQTGRRVLLNMGGIANMTLVPERGDPAPLVAFDTGPGVMVMDACVRALVPGSRYDKDGALAGRGRVLDDVLAKHLANPWFGERPPKSTGRELFGESYAERFIESCRQAGGSTEDTLATATELTARTIALGAAMLPAQPLDVVRSGGGANNPVLVRALERLWPGPEHRAFDEVFFDGDAKEAVAFAFLGYLTWTRRSGNEPGATGAAGPRVLGSITPA